MKICVFDTETISVDKPFCYNVGYIIYDTEKKEIVLKKEFVVEQIWHNVALFSTAYFAEKRPFYVASMRAKKSILKKWGYICQEMIRDFKVFNVDYAYAYNSPFDDRVFNFNCDFFKTMNPFDNIDIIDIAGLVHNKIAFSKSYQDFCENNNLFTESGNYSTTAENVTKYLMNNIDFIEDHTALSDCEIELQILLHCINMNCEFGISYKKYQSIPRKVNKLLTLIDKKDNTELSFEYQKIRINKDRTKIILD